MLKQFKTKKDARQHYFKMRARQLKKVCPLTVDICTEKCASYFSGEFKLSAGCWIAIEDYCTNALVSGVLTMEEV